MLWLQKALDDKELDNGVHCETRVNWFGFSTTVKPGNNGHAKRRVSTGGYCQTCSDQISSS